MAGPRGGPQAFSGEAAPLHSGGIEYGLVRASVLREYRRGRLGRDDICDAQPELLRVARNLGKPTISTCPICEEANLVQVTFAFGARLPASGRALGSGELVKLSRRAGELACYLVEVCTGCSWNHLLRTFSVGRPRPRPS